MSLLLSKSTNNRITVTLNELKSDALPSNWLFVFALDQDEEYTYSLYLTDEALAEDEYNLFYLEDGVDVTFKFLGDYSYHVYQMPDGGSTDTTLGELVENGKMRLIETETDTPTYTPNTNTKIYDPTVIS